MLNLPELSAIRQAQTLLAKYFGATPLVKAPSLSRPDSEVHLKVEIGLPTGSFKPRGALIALAKNLQRRSIEEVTASSTGNHGAAVAFAAKTLGVRATIFLPEGANPVKSKKIEDLGARIVSQGSADLAGAFELAKEYSRRPGVYFLNDATDSDLLAGPGTIGLELLDQLPGLTAVYVPMGDTALIRGIAAAIKGLAPKVRIVGVQAEQAPSYALSWREGKPVPTDSCDTCADGLATRTPDAENVAAIRQIVDEVVLVSEVRMMEAIRHLSRQENVLAEPAGAAATAAWLDRPLPGRVVLLVTGGNISDAVRRQAGL
ncbi:MAG TPA: pyridoxal-phosphate dependent enzyme [Candidatus Sulfotelmatobacter sp.]|nr:pyridoxal-phosphate dependent enzyme [Candidatus Sulfotelmatobacter sp.]